MEKAADIRGRKAHIAKLQEELKAAQAEPSPCAVVKSSIWSAALSDDEVRFPYYDRYLTVPTVETPVWPLRLAGREVGSREVREVPIRQLTAAQM